MSHPEKVEYHPVHFAEAERLRRGKDFYGLMTRRRSVRHFSDRAVPRELIELAIMTASTSPSGAHRQPWRFVAISDPAVKKRIRIAVEEEERESYASRMPQTWRDALKPIGTDWEKPYLEIVPWLIVVFEETFGINSDGTPRKNYYVKESVGMACGLLIAALQNMGLATLTHTPSPMGFLAEILERPPNEKPYVLIPVGYPAEDCTVPDLTRKPLEEISVWF